MVEVIKVEDCGSNIGDYDIPIHNAIIIPEGATNGDMLKTLFPYHSLIFNYDENYILFIIENSMCCKFTLNWWNAPYKKEVE